MVPLSLTAWLCLRATSSPLLELPHGIHSRSIQSVPNWASSSTTRRSSRQLIPSLPTLHGSHFFNWLSVADYRKTFFRKFSIFFFVLFYKNWKNISFSICAVFDNVVDLRSNCVKGTVAHIFICLQKLHTYQRRQQSQNGWRFKYLRQY